jgi:hypothetical protein
MGPPRKSAGAGGDVAAPQRAHDFRDGRQEQDQGSSAEEVLDGAQGQGVPSSQ